jgi:antitoxin component YwqK of YwqJK toxin-antitoxin module
MLRYALLCLFIALSLSGSAQVLISFEFTSEDDNKPIRENDSCKCYIATGDTAHTVCLFDDPPYYKLYTRSRKLIAEGAFTTEGDKYFQEGKWIARFESGKVKRTGYYKHNLPIGTWEEFYSSGKIKAARNYAIFNEGGEVSSCLSGSSTEYYQDGNIKSHGFYTAVLSTVYDTVVVNDPISGQDTRKIVSHRKIKSEKMGEWENYQENGEPERKEENKD